MTHVVVLGGTGHIGGYLVPRLVAAGHEVTVLTRGKATPARQGGAWARGRPERAGADAGGRATPSVRRVRRAQGGDRDRPARPGQEARVPGDRAAPRAH